MYVWCRVLCVTCPVVPVGGRPARRTQPRPSLLGRAVGSGRLALSSGATRGSLAAQPGGGLGSVVCGPLTHPALGRSAPQLCAQPLGLYPLPPSCSDGQAFLPGKLGPTLAGSPDPRQCGPVREDEIASRPSSVWPLCSRGAQGSSRTQGSAPSSLAKAPAPALLDPGRPRETQGVLAAHPFLWAAFGTRGAQFAQTVRRSTPPPGGPRMPKSAPQRARRSAQRSPNPCAPRGTPTLQRAGAQRVPDAVPRQPAPSCSGEALSLPASPRPPRAPSSRRRVSPPGTNATCDGTSLYLRALWSLLISLRAARLGG